MSIAKELECAQLAATLTIGPPIICADSVQEIIIYPYLESAPVNLRQKEKLIAALALLKEFHSSDKTLSFTATPEDFFDLYLEQISKLDIDC